MSPASGLTGGGCPAGREYLSADLLVQVGYGPPGTDPAQSGAWTWAPAYCEAQSGQADVFKGAVTTDTPGDYATAARVSVNGGQGWHHADLDGAGGPFDPTQLGALTVQ